MEVATSTRRTLLRPTRTLVAGVLALTLAAGTPAVSASTIRSVGTPSAGASSSRSLEAGIPAIVTLSSEAAVPTVRPSTPDGPVPRNLRPTLGAAPWDYPLPYLDGCHAGWDGKSTTGACLYGNLRSRTTIAIFGDSHALAWFPAVQRVAERQDWRVLNLTMSACPPADVRVWVPSWDRVSTECTNWREQAIRRLARERPSIILVSGTRGFQLADSSGTVLSGFARTRAWEAGMKRTLARLRPVAGRVIVIADTPLSRVDPPVCLAQHPASVLACSTPVAAAVNQSWLDAEQRVAGQAGVGFIDPTLWVCPSTPCPVVIGNALIFRNAGHLTATFAATMSRRLEQAMALPAAAVV